VAALAAEFVSLGDRDSQVRALRELIGDLRAGAAAPRSRRRRTVPSRTVEEPREHPGVDAGRGDELSDLDRLVRRVRNPQGAGTEDDRRDAPVVQVEAGVGDAGEPGVERRPPGLLPDGGAAEVGRSPDPR
jgi:hypothetical protein